MKTFAEEQTNNLLAVCLYNYNVTSCVSDTSDEESVFLILQNGQLYLCAQDHER